MRRDGPEALAEFRAWRRDNDARTPVLPLPITG
ncbi:MAG: hypothetical protein QOJ55_2685 [Solirubrobacteraceae bacterium]|nr:hypothetical protein [Solirubrobacteraceae bacterium]MDX6674252.1 hypothetical protein [Solirubrobacteraceae bacterium]